MSCSSPARSRAIACARVVHKRKRSYAHARTIEVLEPSPERIAPRADHPGVPWQVLPYERQLEIKRDAGRRGAAADRPAGWLRAARRSCRRCEQWRYRNKLEYSFGDGARTRTSLVCGFHASGGRATRVAPIEDCLLASERGNRAREVGAGLVSRAGTDRLGARQRAAVRARVSDRERTAPGPDGRARLRNLVVREGRRTGQAAGPASSRPTASSTPARWRWR